MGGKSATTTQQVQIPPEVMARYRAVNTRAEEAASQPFQAYSQDPNAFVAPLTQTQQAGIQNINQAAGMTQPYFNTAAGLTMSGAQGVGPLTQQQIQYYQNPFTQSVVGSTLAALQQQQGQQLSQQQAEAIKAGAFGGDRAGIQRAQLQGQQGLATAQAISPLLAQGYQQGVQTAAGQQGVAAQDLQRQLAAGQQLGGLGVAGQQAALAGAQAQLGAGTAEQQTEQAGKTALYNQFLQERGFPFQTAQFLANIAMGTGALSGSTTTTQQPVPFFSDEREKTNVQPLGKGLYAYDYKDDVRRAEEEGRPMPPKRVGPMAQDIEERAPGLVGEINGHKVVKGLSPESMGGAVLDLGPDQYRERFAPGGLVGADDIRAILSAQQQAFGPFAQSGLYGGNPQQGGAGKPGYVPGMALPTPKLMTAGAAPRLPESTVSQGLGTAREFGVTPSKMYEYGQAGLGKAREMTRQGPSRAEPPAPSSQGAIAASAALPSVEWNEEERRRPGQAYGGLVGYAEGGGVDKDDPMAAYGAQGAGIGIPTETPEIKPLEGAKPPSTQPKSIMSDLTDAAKVAASIFAMSDERMKSGMQQVGELYNGLPVYKYRMGDGPSQLGLSAQEAGGLHPEAVMQGDDGLLRLNYDRATRAYGGGLDPRQGYQAGGSPDEDYAIRTIAAEASGKSPEEARAIAHVIQNRLSSGRWGETYRDVVRAPKQFEPWSNPESPNYPMRFSPDSPRYRMAQEALAAARGGEDITGGAMNFYAPAAQAQLAATRGDRAAVPSWARNREYVDFGPTRIVRGVDDPRASGLMAYAGQPQQGEGARNIDRVAGAPAGLGQARPPVSEPAAPTPQERSALAGYLPVKFGTRTVANPKGEEFSGVGEFLTSRQFVQPLLEGIGAMASSQSLSGVGAALQGLGAASKAYTGLEKEMAGMQTEGEQARFVQAQTEEAKAATARANVRTLGDGTTIVNYFDPKTGGYKTIRSYEYFDLPEELKPALSALDRQKLESAAEFDRRRAAEAKPAGQPATTTTTTTPPGEAAAAPRVDVKLSPDAITAARDEARELQRMQMGPDRNKAIDENLRIASEARKQRDASLRLTGNLNDLAKPLAGLSAGQQIAPGAFSKVLSMAAKTINSAADQLNLPKEYRVALQGSSQYELAQKAARILTEAKAANLGQRAESALTTLEQGLADPSKQGDTIAEILAAAYVEKQKGLEEAKFIDAYSRSAGAGITVAKNASSLFRSQEGTRDEDYSRDQAIIKQFLKEKITEEGPSKGKSLLSFLLQQNPNDPLQKKITPEIINQMYGADIARYFLNK